MANKKQDGLWLDHMPLSETRPALRNPKEHEVPGIISSIERYGAVAPAVMNEATGRYVAGHGRREALLKMRDRDPAKPPRYVQLREDGEWLIPVLRGVRFDSEQEAEEYLVAVNRWVEVGGWEPETMVPMLEQLAARDDAGALRSVGWSVKQIERYVADFDAEAAVRGKTPADLAAGYNVGAVKQIVCYYAADDAEAVLQRLSAVMRAEKVPSNSAALVRMLEVFEKRRGLKALKVAA